MIRADFWEVIMRLSALSFLWLFALAMPLFAHDHAHHHESHEAHVHGKAQLQVAGEGTDLLVSLRSPAANFLGFEHTPQTEKERKTANQARDFLQKVAQWLGLEGGNCRIASVDIGNAEAHEHHTDIEVEAMFHCAKLAELQGLSLELFSEFPAVETIELEWVIEQRQGSAVLSREKPRAALGR